MPIEFLCHSCSTKLRVGDETAGKQAKCPKCGTVLDIPGGSATPAPPSEPASGTGYAVGPVQGGAAPNPYQPPGQHAQAHQSGFTKQPVARGTVDPGEAFSQGWELFTKYIGQSLLAMIVVTVVAMVAMFAAMMLAFLSAALLASMGGEEMAIVGIFGGGMLFGIPSFIVLYLLQYNMWKYYLALARHENPDFGMLFRYEGNFWPTMGSIIAFSFLVMIGYVFCIVPGVLLTCMFFPWVFLVLERKMPIGEAFNLSKQLTEGNKMNIFVVGMIIFGISMAAGFVPFGGLLVQPFLNFILIVCYFQLTGQSNRRQAPSGNIAAAPQSPAGGNPFAT